MPTDTLLIIFISVSSILLFFFATRKSSNDTQQDEQPKQNTSITSQYTHVGLEERLRQLGVYDELRTYFSESDYQELYNEFYSYFREGINFGASPKEDLISAIFQSIRDTKLELMAKLLGFAELHIGNENLHFIYNRMQELAYKQRETSLTAIDMTVALCLKDIEHLKNNVGTLFKPNPYFTDKRGFCDLGLPCADRLLIIYEKQKEYTKALNLAHEVKSLRERDALLVQYDERKFEYHMNELNKRITRIGSKIQ